MRTRITLLVVVVIAGALLLAGAVSFSLVREAALHSRQQNVLREADALARDERVAVQPGVLALLGRTSRVTTNAIELRADGAILGAQPPLKVSQKAINTRAVVAGRSVSGVSGDYAFAVVPLKQILGRMLGGGSTVTIAFALESPVSDAFDSLPYFLLAGAVSLLVAAIAVAAIARRISRRVVAASQAAQRIAGGDLDTRVAPAPRAYPELAGHDA